MLHWQQWKLKSRHPWSLPLVLCFSLLALSRGLAGKPESHYTEKVKGKASLGRAIVPNWGLLQGWWTILKYMNYLLNFPVINWKNATWINPRLKSGLQQALHLVMCRFMEIQGWRHQNLCFWVQFSKWRSRFCGASNSQVTWFGPEVVIEIELFPAKHFLKTYCLWSLLKGNCGTSSRRCAWSGSRMQWLEAAIDFHHCSCQAR